MQGARLTGLTLRDFRNIAHAELTLAREGIVVVGENGQGKTNLVEAIAYFRLLRSMRGARDRDLVRHGAPAFHIAAALADCNAHRATAGADTRGRKKLTLDGGEPERLVDALDTLPSVSFSPRDVDLVAGAPSERRRYLDITLALTSPGYLRALRGYRDALERRNAALRDVRDAARTPAHYEPALARHGAVLVRARRAWVAERAEAFRAKCTRIGEREAPAMGYASAWADAEDPEGALRGRLEQQRPHDLKRGMTQSGPHRDDLALSLDGHDIRGVGSAGQQRTAAIVLRLLEAATHRDATGTTPVLLLDDPFAELDRGRAQRILALLEEMEGGQVVLCVPREDEVPPRFTRLARWRVRAGVFSPAGSA